MEVTSSANMSVLWFVCLLVIVAVAPFAVAIVTLLQQGDALLAAALMVTFLASVIVILMRLLTKPPEDNDTDTIGEGLSTSLAAAESPPAYDVVIKSPPPYISYPGQEGAAYPSTNMYYCYCGSSSNTGTAAASLCKPCSLQSNVPYSIHLSSHNTSSHPDGTNQGCSDPFLPSYSEAVKVYTHGSRPENTPS